MMKRIDSKERGQAMIVATIFFLVISLTIIFGISTPLLAQKRISSDLVRSRQSYFLAEAGNEDVLYRLENAMPVNSSGQTLTIGNSTVTTVVTPTPSGQTIVSTGNFNQRVRKVETKLRAGVGEAFNYGIQVGAGGFELANNAGVNGNVYSNGSITGSPGAFISGSVSAVTSVSDLTVGTGLVGDVRANSVTGSTVRGSLYCQTGSGNNKPCDTSQPALVSQPFPITDAEITTWKDQALAGGVFTGNKVISTNTTLGPLKIVGDLTINIDRTLTLNGTLWVTGNILLNNGSVIKVNSTYGTNSGVIVTDGRATVSNNATFLGSGTSGSYLMLLTTSDCPTSASCGGQPAISLQNNIGAAILNAQNGTITLSNNSGASQLTASTIALQNNAVITYTQGLIDVNFTSGPGGGWEIDDWKEIK